MKKGFTLIELLAVVTLIGLLAVLIIPKITENINKKKSQISAANMKLLESATDIYIEKNKQNYASTYEANGSTYCIPIQSLIDESIITTPFKDVNGKEIDYTQIIEATYNANYNNFSYRLVKNGECTETINYVNRPQLADNMIPVVYDGDKWVKADINTKWYNYSEKNWANAVLVKESKTNEENSKSRNEYKDSIPGTPIQESDILAYFVWIPRFRYQLFSSDEQIEIKIAFENVGTKTMGTQTGEWLTHPAFTINNQELAGIWVGKYETSSEDSKPVIKKDKTPWTNIEFSSAAQVSSEMANQNNIYGLSDINTHLIKNDEWGAVAYLTNSKYGINAKMDSKTSSNTGDSTSTTGNMTGIYDMGGLSQEYVIVTEQSEETLGSSLSETSKWYDETNTFITEENEYLTRGKSSILNYSNTDEKDKTSFRVALINNYAYPSIYPNQLQGDEPGKSLYANGNEIYFDVDDGRRCTLEDYEANKAKNTTENPLKSGCMKFFSFLNSENSDTVNLILDHNTTSIVAWEKSDESNSENYTGPGSDEGEVLKVLQDDTKGWSSELQTPDSYTAKWISGDQERTYTVNYNGYKARLITAEEIAKITGNDSWTLSSAPFYFDTNCKDACQVGTNEYWWLFDNTATCAKYGCKTEDDRTFGYWTASSYTKMLSFAWEVEFLGSLNANGVYRDDSTSFGVRPVIKVLKSKLLQ